MNMFLMIHLGHIARLVKKTNQKLLTIKIYAVLVWKNYIKNIFVKIVNGNIELVQNCSIS